MQRGRLRVPSAPASRCLGCRAGRGLASECERYRETRCSGNPDQPLRFVNFYRSLTLKSRVFDFTPGSNSTKVLTNSTTEKKLSP
ncbi:hypothetical protein TURU_141806 [Turdus rufiventris]|nr:hypothetical protein TURU_141806 [Turdus rufiventris]